MIHFAVSDVLALEETTQGLRVRIRGQEMWLPPSQITDDSEVWAEGQRGELCITLRLAEELGLL